MAIRTTGCWVMHQRIADCCARCVFAKGSALLDPPDKRLQRARRPVSSPPSDSARKPMPRPPMGP
eukprot:15470578-Alexandrium_andersonii.AAC.1